MRTRSTRTLAALTILAAAALVAVAGAGAAHKAVTPPPSIKSAGQIVWCSDMTYPPEESQQGSTPVGSDIDIASAVSKLMGVKASFKNTGFDGIIAALLGKRCDAIISGMTDNAQRRKQVDFTDYANVGMSLMVKAGNPSHITGLNSLSGKSAAAESGTTEKDVLTALNVTLKKQGKPTISIKIFPSDTNAAAALLTGKVDAYFADDPPVAYYVKKAGGKFVVAASKIQSAPIGIATRKGDALSAAMKQAIDQLYANGTMATILKKWGMSAFALKK
jgi:polar amino acid transport system substrate-binding protein